LPTGLRLRCNPGRSRERSPEIARSTISTAAAAGTLYPFAAIELTREDWRRHYGAQWHSIEQAKRRDDPDAVFASGPNLYFT
jgi:Cytokinin dehydrogenase 1, FAD and cytokinin binding